MTEKPPQPMSLGAYQVPEEREALIKAHIAMLSETARGVSDRLAFGADTSDITGILEANAEDGNASGEGER